MASKHLTLKLTADQQRQIKESTGKVVAELNIDFALTGELSDKDLDRVAAGKKSAKKF